MSLNKFGEEGENEENDFHGQRLLEIRTWGRSSGVKTVVECTPKAKEGYVKELLLRLTGSLHRGSLKLLHY